jgi:hypothetical protein
MADLPGSWRPKVAMGTTNRILEKKLWPRG